MVQLVPMTEREYQEWLEPFIQEYGQEHLENGRWSAENFLQRAREEMEQYLPAGLQTKDHYLYTIMADDLQRSVGMLWFSVRERPSGKQRAFVFNIEIDAAYRQCGYASQAFVAMEQKVRALGIDEIGLHVFGFNHVARAMYEKLGYRITHVEMAKSLTSLDV